MNSVISVKKLTTVASASSVLLKRIGRPLRSLLAFSPADDRIYPSKNLSVSMDKGTFSIAYGSRSLSKIKIGWFREYPFEEEKYPQPETLASSLALAISDLRATKVNVTLGIPKEWIVIKTAEFPVTVKENLPDVVSYELDRLTPFNAEDAFYDFKVLKESAGKLIVLVMAAKAELIKPYIEALREIGIHVTKISANLSSIETLCRFIDKRTDSIFVEIKQNGYEGALFLNGSIDNAFTGSFTAADEKSKVDSVMAEIAPIIDTVKEQGKAPQVMLLLKDKNPVLKELLKLQVSPAIRILNETDIKIRFSETYKEIPYAAIGGVLESLWLGANGLNLLKKGYRERLKTPKAFTIILILVLLVMWMLYIIAPLRVEEKRLNEIDHQIKLRKEDVMKVETLKKDIEAVSKEVSTINNFKGQRQTVLNMLKELTTILPKNIWLTRVRITEAAVNIEGYAASTTGLLSKLEASKYFRKVEFASPTFRDSKMNADRFNIKLEVEGVEKLEGVKGKGQGIEGGNEEE
jgi:Tfp pilus assembly protein PilN